MRNMIESTLRKIDIYGFVTGFSYSKHSQYKSRFGGFLTVLTFAIGIILFIQICLPVFWHFNPSVYSQTMHKDEYTYYSLTNKNFPIAFRFEDETRSPVNVTNKLFTYAEAIELKKNNITGIMKVVNHTFIKVKDCNKSTWDIPEVDDNNGFKCLDFREEDKYRLGGGLYSSHSVYFKITVFFCAYDGKNYTQCSNYETLNDFLSGQKKIYLSVWFPDLAINPLNIKRPLRVSYENSLNTLSPLLMKTDRYYYHHTKLSQDSGIIMPVNNEYNGYTFTRKETEYQIRTIPDIMDNKKIRTLSTSVFSIDNKEDDISIRYKKLQTQLSDLNSLIKIITVLFFILNNFVGEKVIFIKIADKIFNVKFSKKDEEFYNYIMHRKKDMKIAMINGNNVKNNKNEILEANYGKGFNKKKNSYLKKFESLELSNLHKLMAKSDAQDKPSFGLNNFKREISNKDINEYRKCNKLRDNYFYNTCLKKEEKDQSIIFKNDSNNSSRRSDNSLDLIDVRKNIKEILKARRSKQTNNNNNYNHININYDNTKALKESNADLSVLDKSNIDNKLIDVSDRKRMNLEDNFSYIEKLKKDSHTIMNPRFDDNKDKNNSTIDNSDKFIIGNIINIFDMKSKFYLVFPFKTKNRYMLTNIKIFRYMEDQILEKLDVFFYVKIMFLYKKYLLEEQGKNLLGKDFTFDIENL